MELQQILDILRRRKWIALQALLAITVTAMGITFLLTPTYTAWGKIYIKRVPDASSQLKIPALTEVASLLTQEQRRRPQHGARALAAVDGAHGVHAPATQRRRRPASRGRADPLEPSLSAVPEASDRDHPGAGDQPPPDLGVFHRCARGGDDGEHAGRLAGRGEPRGHPRGIPGGAHLRESADRQREGRVRRRPRRVPTLPGGASDGEPRHREAARCRRDSGLC